MTLTYLGLGSNMDNPRAQLRAAAESIDRLPRTTVLRSSPLYGSKAWGKTDQADFVNMVLEVETGLMAEALLKECKRIEQEQGRTAGERWGPRPVDLDILLFGAQEISTPTLQVPHPRMWQRGFVLKPLADLAPDLPGPDGMPVGSYLERPEIVEQGVWLYEE